MAPHWQHILHSTDNGPRTHSGTACSTPPTALRQPAVTYSLRNATQSPVSIDMVIPSLRDRSGFDAHARRRLSSIHTCVGSQEPQLKLTVF